MYLGEADLAALLESVFHDVHHSADRFVYEQSLREMLVAHVRTAEELRLADLRDPVLNRSASNGNGSPRARQSITRAPGD